MEFEINVISIPDAITADAVKELVRQHEEAEMKTDIDAILECVRTKPWADIRLRGKQGKTSYDLTIGFDSGNTCHVRQTYGWVWLQESGAQLIVNLFTSLGYKVQITKSTCYFRFTISWAE